MACGDEQGLVCANHTVGKNHPPLRRVKNLALIECLWQIPLNDGGR